MAPLKLTVRPRVQRDKWSVYWKESMVTVTELLEECSMEVEGSTTVAELLTTVAKKQGWQPADELLRLDGFNDPWDKAIFKGRELRPEGTLEEQGLGGDAAVVTCLRRVLVADGWKIRTGDELDESSDEEDDESFQQKF